MQIKTGDEKAEMESEWCSWEIVNFWESVEGFAKLWEQLPTVFDITHWSTLQVFFRSIQSEEMDHKNVVVYIIPLHKLHLHTQKSFYS